MPARFRFSISVAPILRSGVLLPLFLWGLVTTADAGAIHTAIQRNDLAAVKRIVESDPKQLEAVDNPNAQQTPLHYAAMSGRTEIFKYLLDQGADPTKTNRYKQSALDIAVTRRSTPIVTLLLDHDPAPDLNAKSQNGWTPLISAIRYNNDLEIVKLLLDAGADPNAADNYGRTPLHNAIQSNRVPIVSLLLDNDQVKVSTQDNSGMTPLFAAVQAYAYQSQQAGGKTIVPTLLKRGADPTLVTKNQQTLLHSIAQSRSADLFDVVPDLSEIDVNATDSGGGTALMYAVGSGNLEVIQQLIELGADPAIGTKRSGRGYPILLAAGNSTPEIVKALLDAGARANRFDTEGNSTLHYAARNNQAKTIAVLLDAGANPDKKNREGSKPLDLAIAMGHFPSANTLFPVTKDLKLNSEGEETVLHWASRNGLDKAIPSLLKRKGVDPLAKTTAGETPLDLATEGGHTEVVAALLADERVNPKKWDATSANPLHTAAWSGQTEIAALYLMNGANPNSVDDTGYTPLHAAALGGHGAIVDELLKLGAKPGVATPTGYTPLHAAAWNGSTPAIGSLLLAGAKINAADNDGLTPLHRAAWRGHENAVTLLLAQGADAFAKDQFGYTPKTYAENQGHKNLARLLSQ